LLEIFLIKIVREVKANGGDDLNIKVNIKQLGSKRAKINGADFMLEHKPTDVQGLITEAVHTCVDEYNQRVRSGENAVKPLSDNSIKQMSEIGKIAFGINYGGKEADEQRAVETALQAYEDGLVRIFIGEEEAGVLSDKVILNEGDSVTFIKLAMLSGRMW